MELSSTLRDQTGSQKSNMAAAKPEVLISQVLDKVDTKFQMLHPHFRGPASQWSCHQHCGVKPEVRNQIWRKPRYAYFRLSGRHLPLLLTLHSVYSVPVVKLDPENISVALAVSLLSCLGAEVLAFLYPLSVCDRHLGFSTTAYTAQCLHWSHREAEPRKHRCSRWNFVATMYTSWDITLFHIYFRLMAAILDLSLTLISHSIVTSPILFQDLKHVGVIVWILLLSSRITEIWVLPV
jgi:hypothetical protein